MSASHNVRGVEDPLFENLGYQLRRVSLLIMSDLHHRLRVLNITVAKASVLRVIECNEGIKLIAVADCLDIKRANITPMITELEKRGLIIRAIDGRAHALKLSKKGVAVVAQIRLLMAESEEFCFGHLDKASRETLSATLSSVRSVPGLSSAGGE